MFTWPNVPVRSCTATTWSKGSADETVLLHVIVWSWWLSLLWSWCLWNRHSSRCPLLSKSRPAPLISKSAQRYTAAANKMGLYFTDRLHWPCPCPWTLTLGGSGGVRRWRLGWVFISQTPVWLISDVHFALIPTRRILSWSLSSPLFRLLLSVLELVLVLVLVPVSILVSVLVLVNNTNNTNTYY